MFLHLVLDMKLVFVLLIALGIVANTHVKRFLVRRRFARRNGCQPVARSFNKDPIFGLDTVPGTLRAIRQHKVLERSCELFRIYGNTFTTKELHTRAILTVEPENIKTVLSLNFKDYGIGHRLKPFKPLLGVGILDTDGEQWASSRALIRPSVTRHQVADLTYFESLIQDLFARLPRDGKTVVDLSDLFFRFSMDSATDFFFGQSVASLKSIQPEVDFAQAFDYAQKAMLTRSMLGWLNMFHRDPKADECNRICREFAQQFVDKAFQAIEAEKKDKDLPQVEPKRQKHLFLHELASRTSDRHRALDELMNVLLAARDTTASLLSNLFFMLAKNPAIWSKLCEEVSGLNGQVPTYEEVRSLRYVQCCINECMKIFLP